MQRVRFRISGKLVVSQSPRDVTENGQTLRNLRITSLRARYRINTPAQLRMASRLPPFARMADERLAPINSGKREGPVR